MRSYSSIHCCIELAPDLQHSNQVLLNGRLHSQHVHKTACGRVFKDLSIDAFLTLD